MPAIPSPVELVSDAKSIVAAVESILTIADDLPLPAEVKTFLGNAQEFAEDVQKYLNS